MARKSRADILEKLSALKPSEPTKTRGPASGRAAVKRQKVKIRSAAERPAPAPPAAPVAPAPPLAPKESPASGAGPSFRNPFGNAVRVYLDAYDCWFKIIRNTSSLFVNSVTVFWDVGRWRR